MIVVILKNTLLILLIVLIIHFMIKNRIMDDIDNFKRKLVHDDTLNELHNQQRESGGGAKQQMVEEERDLSSTRAKKKLVSFDGETKFDEKEYVPECPNGLTCDDFNLTDKSVGMMTSKEENSMKELYDFVYDEVSKEENRRPPTNEDNLNLQPTEETHQRLQDYFPEGQTFDTKVDKTEIDTHYSSKSMEMVPNGCNFEVVGMIDVEGDDSVFGLDTLTSNNFSTIL